MNDITRNKILQTLNYLADSQKDKKISEMKAYKLIWLADRYHLRQYGRTITNDDYFALPHGVVPSYAKQIIDGQSFKEKTLTFLNTSPRYNFASIKKPEINVFSETDIEVLDLIIKTYGELSTQKLSALSHKFPEWKRYEEKLKEENGKKSYKIIVSDFFTNFDDGRGLFVDDQEFLSIVKELSEEMN